MAEAKQEKSKAGRLGFGIFIGSVPLIFILYLVLGPIIDAIEFDKNVQTMFILSQKANLRSDAEIKSFKIGQYEYGTELKVFKIEEDWAYVSVDGKKGYISTNLLAAPKEFYLIEGLYGTEETKKQLSNTIYKRALARYLIENNYISTISDDIKLKYFEGDENHEVWQVFCTPASERYDAFALGDFDGDKQNDAAFVLKSPESEKSRLVIISFDKENPEEKSKTIFTLDFEAEYYMIKTVGKGNRMYISEPEENAKPKKEITKIDGLLIGSNRNKSFQDSTKFLLYNGTEFVLHSQDLD